MPLQKTSRKAGLPPETLIYTGEKKAKSPQVTLLSFNATQLQEAKGTTLEECLTAKLSSGLTWINVDGLENVDLLKNIGATFNLKGLTLEDILNTNQRPKIEEFENYIFIVLKIMLWNATKKKFSVEQISIVFGENFLLSFQESTTSLITQIQERIRKNQGRLRNNGSDYLAYSLLDIIIDQEFIILDYLGETIEKIEDSIVGSSKPKNLQELYSLKRKILLFRKAVWPTREIVNHLLHATGPLVATTTIPYLRDVYDHIVQVMDTIETFRDLLSNILDIYLASLTNKTNEVMKVLTIIATIFIPITFIASIYGMNFTNMPELHWRYGYPFTLLTMLIVTICMLAYFKNKKWF